jgi:hypothetical protein
MTSEKTILIGDPEVLDSFSSCDVEWPLIARNGPQYHDGLVGHLRATPPNVSFRLKKFYFVEA